ncbi:hypothetical protein J2Z48_002989 [Croceifilum oryzae]|uniref:Uncharacterized protein n=1 Tax=Croceifilum oryzae TaxID=1553429 RepID=A0AAJ1TPW5_9BACL|nr:hypothetical protein [Croceifilum oryzae]MDQ0418785.1 hypothetical protein [Croceifilum oryzae]
MEHNIIVVGKHRFLPESYSLPVTINISDITNQDLVKSAVEDSLPSYYQKNYDISFDSNYIFETPVKESFIEPDTIHRLTMKEKYLRIIRKALSHYHHDLDFDEIDPDEIHEQVEIEDVAKLLHDLSN